MSEHADTAKQVVHEATLKLAPHADYPIPRAVLRILQAVQAAIDEHRHDGLADHCETYLLAAREADGDDERALRRRRA